MLTESTNLAEVEEYVEHCALHEMEKAGLWMLAWAHQDQATQLRLAKETLALVSSMRSPTKSGRKGPPPRRPLGTEGLPASGSSTKRQATGILTEIEAQQFDDAVAVIENEQRAPSLPLLSNGRSSLPTTPRVLVRQQLREPATALSRLLSGTSHDTRRASTPESPASSRLRQRGWSGCLQVPRPAASKWAVLATLSLRTISATLRRRGRSQSQDRRSSSVTH